VLYKSGNGVKKNVAEALEWLQLAADQGDCLAQYILGCHYAQGDGVEQDYGRALELLHKSAEQDCPEAQCKLCDIYEHGNGVEPDAAEAFAFFNLAARKDARLAKTRDTVGKYMDPRQFAKAQIRFQELLARLKPPQY
jgi:TPR repeat protein